MTERQGRRSDSYLNTFISKSTCLGMPAQSDACLTHALAVKAQKPILTNYLHTATKVGKKIRGRMKEKSLLS